MVGRSQAAAPELAERQGFKVRCSDEYSDQFAAGFVTRQPPAAGTKLRKGGTVDIWVSQGATTVALTDFRGWAPPTWPPG